MPEPAPRRRRRTPEAARDEILDAAERLLAVRPVRDLAVDELMAETTLRRSSFYVYFEDRGALMLGMLDRLQGRVLLAGTPWLRDLTVDATAAQAIAALRQSLSDVTRVFSEHGALIVAVSEAAVMDEKVETMYRGVLLQGLVDAVAARLIAERRAGRSAVPRPKETATALVLLNERYSADRLGRPPRRPARDVAAVLQHLWIGAIYGADLLTPRH